MKCNKIQLVAGGQTRAEGRSQRAEIFTGRKYTDDDAGCCPSQPYESIFVVTNGKMEQKQ